MSTAPTHQITAHEYPVARKATCPCGWSSNLFFGDSPMLEHEIGIHEGRFGLSPDQRLTNPIYI